MKPSASGSGAEAPTAEERARLVEYFRERSSRLEPIPPAPLPEPFSSLVGRPLPFRPLALVLDVYGTLLASRAGEVGTAAEGTGKGTLELSEILSRFGVPKSPEDFEDLVRREILRDHEAARAAGIPFPEVDGAALLSRITGLPLPDARLLGAAREAALNPASGMPGALELLTAARKAGVALGIVSNAQYYTVPVLEAAFGKSLERLGFSEDLCVWSWRVGRAKPDPELFRILSRALSTRGITPDRVVYVGNDLLNDVAPARSEGFRTALFAGDARSLRLRAGDERVENIRPDTVLPSFLGASSVFRLGGRDPFCCMPRSLQRSD